MREKTILFIQNYATDPPHLVGQWLEEIGFATKVILAYEGEEIPKTVPSEVAAIIPLGGAMNALQDDLYPWLVDEKTLIRKAIEAGVPVLGICLGAQLLGAALGGKVDRLAANEIGIYEINQVHPDSIFNFSTAIPTTQWHEDFVSELPIGATLVAQSNLCPVQIFKVSDLSYGLQCHPEADASIVALWEAKPDNAFKNFAGVSNRETIAATVKIREADLVSTWKPMIQRWGRAVLESSTIR